jgi:hypothetical protein
VLVAPRKALLAAVATTAACFAYRPAAPTPQPGARVRVVFATAIAVTTHAGGQEGAHRMYPGVLEASGTIQAAASDTLALRLGELRTAAGPIPNVSDQVAMLPTAQIARMEQRRFQAGSTILMGVGVVVVAATASILVLIVALTRAGAF